ncbi:MAG TPA: response regulator [bacterium]|nr:response regulator [bacterium]
MSVNGEVATEQQVALHQSAVASLEGCHLVPSDQRSPLPDFNLLTEVQIESLISEVVTRYGLRILVIDDSDEVRRSLVALLTFYGAQVDVASTYDEALQMLDTEEKRRGYDLITLDIELDGIQDPGTLKWTKHTGIELLQTIVGNPEREGDTWHTNHMPLIMFASINSEISTSRFPDYLGKYQEQFGSVDEILKPLDVRQFYKLANFVHQNIPPSPDWI